MATKEKFEEAKRLYETANADQRYVLESLFPELAESEDEKIRKALIRYFTLSDEHAYNEACGVSYRDIVAWLEKQAEQKPDTDFSDLRTWKYIVDAVLTEKEGIGQYLDSPFTEEVAKKLHKRFGSIEQNAAWSEKDAKLWLHDDDIFLDAAKVIVGDSPRRSYGGVHKKEIVPWLLSLKERLKAVKDRVQPQPKQEWSEEDEEHIKSLLERLEGMCKKGATFIRTGFAVSEDEDWLKHLKDRVLQPKQEWSEEDKRKIDRIYYILRQAADTHAFSTSCRLIGDKECIELQDFLKSITLHNTWKPSDEQMKILNEVLNFAANHKSPHWNDYLFGTLNNLIRQLKKLRDE